jgi:hypothetical protein
VVGEVGGAAQEQGEAGWPQRAGAQLGNLLDRHWRLVVVLAWLLLSAWFLYSRWNAIQGFALGDTDDNLRISQVRALLAGQHWFDLTQHRFSAQGSNIHWSRVVDLPLAALILLARPFVGGAAAEQFAVAVAPLLPLLLALFCIALVVRRLVGPSAYPIAFVAFFFAPSASGMFMPLRIDHHGWQLAFLTLAVAGLADPRKRRGGLVAGAATALSLAIGLELLVYLALAGAATVLFWIADEEERERLSAYAVVAGGGTAVAFLLFASNANRLAVCDALSPVWLSDAVLASGVLFALALLLPKRATTRWALAIGAGTLLAGFHALAWPHCLSRLEGVSPEVYDLWLEHVREARPFYRHARDTAIALAAIPLTGLVGWLTLIWFARKDRERLRRVLAAAAPAIAATLLLLWQTRTGPAAQLLGTMGCTALLWLLAPRAFRARNPVVSWVAPPVIAALGMGALVPTAMNFKPQRTQTPREQAIGRANRQCTSLAGLRPVAKQPRGMVFTFIDLGPRLIAVTHHRAVGGPYHRNGEAIADVMKAFRGSPEQARRIVAKYRADYLLICPNMSTSTIFRAEAPNGFYGQLERNRVPGWLQPVPLPKDSPFRMWRVTL